MSDFENPILDSIAFDRRRRAKGGATLAYVRDLDEGDAEELENPTPTGKGTSYNSQTGTGLKRLRHTHHLLAMVLAEGASHAQASGLTGYSPATIAMLSLDPTFQELIAHYRVEHMAEYEDIRRRAASLGLSFLDELQERLEEAPDAFTNKEVKETAAMLLDRTILPAKTQSTPAAAAPAQPFSVGIAFIQAPSQGEAPLPPRTIELTPRKDPLDDSSE